MPSQGCFPQLSLCPFCSLQRVPNLTVQLLFSSRRSGKFITSYTHCLLLLAAGGCLKYRISCVSACVCAANHFPSPASQTPNGQLFWGNIRHLPQITCGSVEVLDPEQVTSLLQLCQCCSAEATWIWICCLSTLRTSTLLITWYSWRMKYKCTILKQPTGAGTQTWCSARFQQNHLSQLSL